MCRFAADVIPKLAEGAFRIVVDKEFPLEQLQQAHEYMETNANMGKIVIRVSDV